MKEFLEFNAPNRKTYEHIHKFGRNADVDTGTDPEDVWSVGGLYSFPTAAAAVTIKSTSTVDNSAGTGARTVKCYGLDASFKQLESTVTLNGTTAVTLDQSFYRLHRAKVLTAGSGGVNAGNLDFVHSSTTIARIDASMGQTLMAIYTTPSSDTSGTVYGKNYFVGWTVNRLNTRADEDARFELWFQENGAARQVKEVLGVGSGGFAEGTRVIWQAVNPGTDIWVRCVEVSANNTDSTATFEIVSVKNA